MIKTGHQFNVNMIDFDVIVGKLRKKVKLANALREYEGTDNPKGRNDSGYSWNGRNRFVVEVYYRLGRGNPNSVKYADLRRRNRVHRIAKEDAQYASVYVRDEFQWKA